MSGYNRENFLDKEYQARRADRLVQFNKTRIPYTPLDNTFGDRLGAISSLAGAAATLSPVLAPVAAAGAVGYGVYKLGQSFKLW